MGQHYLTHLFNPRVVALFGASDSTETVGGVILRNLIEGDYQGQLFAINPRYETVQGLTCHKSLDSVEPSIDLAIIATPANSVPDVLEACGRRRIPGAIILSAGFREIGPRGAGLERMILELARHYGIRILGAKGLGMIRPHLNLHAGFAEGRTREGDIALIGQSASICASIIDWAHSDDVGFSTITSVGTSMDLDYGEILDYLTIDMRTQCIMLHLESVRDARRFMSALRAAARAKPVIALKSARHNCNAKAAQSHTAAMIGGDDAFDAALSRAGVVRVSTIGDLFSAAKILSVTNHPVGNRLTIVSNGGGPAILAADRAADLGVNLATLDPKTIGKLNALLPDCWSHASPVDILGDADTQRFIDSVRICLGDPNTDGVLAILTPQALVDPVKLAEGLVELSRGSGKVLLACWMGEIHVREARRLLAQSKIPSFRSPEPAIEAYAVLARHSRNRAWLMQTPSALSDPMSKPDVDGARVIIETALSERRKTLSALESHALLAAFRIPVTHHVLARSPNEAMLLAEQIGLPVAMKVVSPDILHKTEVGGVMLNLTSALAVRTAYNDLVETVRRNAPHAQVDGVSVEPMQNHPNGREVMIGVHADPVFGPIITFGQGGIATEAAADTSVALPPLNPELISGMISEAKVYRQLGAFRNKPPANLRALEALLLRVSEMVCELPWLKELDINPIVVDERGAIALDARVVVDHHMQSQDRYGHMAISPYPAHLVDTWQLADGTNVTLRPVRPEDADLQQDFVRTLTPESRFLRFQLRTNELNPATLARFVQIDYDRELALVATSQIGGNEILIGDARYYTNPDGETCEFGLVVSDKWRSRGLGAKLMIALMEAARQRGLKTIVGDVLTNNAGMLRLMRTLGFQTRMSDEDEDLVIVSKLL